jgi:mRNA-degrading endonuclease RelE of RelBE toxin-antitoxin system
MRKLVLNKAILKELEALPPKQYRQVVCAILDLLAEPCPHFSKVLQGTAYRRLAIGEYRVVYRVDEEFVHLVVAGTRNEDEARRPPRSIAAELKQLRDGLEHQGGLVADTTALLRQMRDAE